MQLHQLSTLTVSLALSFSSPAVAKAIEFTGTPFERAGNQFNIEPALIYAVSLAESARGQSGQLVAPHPYTLRVADQPGFYAASLQEAQEKLDDLMRDYRSIDICLMQVNTRWNGHRVASPHDLLDIDTCILVGTEILREAIDSAPNDLLLGIGRYYNWNDENAARNYGERVMSFYNNITRGRH